MDHSKNILSEASGKTCAGLLPAGKRICFLLLLAAVLAGCFRSRKDLGKPVAMVGSKYLYESQLPALSGPGISAQDSIRIRKSYIDKWIRRQLLLDKAEQNLTSEQKDVTDQLEEYRASLLIYKYQDMLMRQQMDTIVSEDEIQKYYTEHSGSFILNQPVFKGVFLMLPLNATNLQKVREWTRSPNEENIKNLESYCFQYARKYDYFNDQWTYFQNLLLLAPGLKINPEQFLRAYKFYEYSDSLNIYMIGIRDYLLPGAVSPLDLVRDDIRAILLNRRKLEFIKDLENKIYNQAYDKAKVKIFENK